MKQKPHALAGILAAVFFVCTYFLLSNARPEFNHFTRAVSELGSVGAPYASSWNLFGCIIPGLLIVYFAIGLHQSVTQGAGGGQLPFYGLVLSGLFMVLSGVFPDDFENRNTLTMLFSIGSFGAFLIAAFCYPPVLRKIPYWEKTILPALLLSWLCLFSSFLRSGTIHGFGQRIGFALYFLWIVFMAINLYRYTNLDKV